MLVTNIFSFSHYVFKRLLFQGHQKSGLYGKELNDQIWSRWGAKHSEVRRNRWLPAFSSISTIFSKAFYPSVDKSGDYMVKYQLFEL